MPQVWSSSANAWRVCEVLKTTEKGVYVRYGGDLETLETSAPTSKESKDSKDDAGAAGAGKSSQEIPDKADGWYEKFIARKDCGIMGVNDVDGCEAVGSGGISCQKNKKKLKIRLRGTKEVL